jgi:CemA family
MNNSFINQKLYPWLLASYHWYLRTPERSLDEAQKAALQIKTLEDEHFNGKKIDSESSEYSASVMDFFQSDLKKQLQIARMRLTEFKISRYFLSELNPKAAIHEGIQYSNSAEILRKLNFIDSIISKYTSFEDVNISPITLSESSPLTKSQVLQIEPVKSPLIEAQVQPNIPKNPTNNRPQSKANSTGILPRSILNTIHRLQVELDPKSEEEVVRDFRKAQRRTIISVRFVLLLIIIPILTHQVSKALIVGPIVGRFRDTETAKIFLNYEMEEAALEKLHQFEEKTKFLSLISEAPSLSPEQMEEEVKKEAGKIREEFREESSNAVKNVFADMFSVTAFIILLLMSKKEVSVLKDFFDNLVYGLSDSAKAFIIILFTDVFVGFHSPHGWEIILEGLSRHWGLPASRDFIFLFIATFPVILDTIFKYWIFRYLSRISPSAVATYRNMNE